MLFSRRNFLLSMGLLATGSNVVFANKSEFEDYKKQQLTDYQSYVREQEEAFRIYQKSYSEAFARYKKNITSVWQKAEVTTPFHRNADFWKNLSG